MYSQTLFKPHDWGYSRENALHLFSLLSHCCSYGWTLENGYFRCCHTVTPQKFIFAVSYGVRNISCSQSSKQVGNIILEWGKRFINLSDIRETSDTVLFDRWEEGFCSKPVSRSFRKASNNNNNNFLVKFSLHMRLASLQYKEKDLLWKL